MPPGDSCAGTGGDEVGNWIGDDDGGGGGLAPSLAGEVAATDSVSGRPVVVQKMADPWSAPQNLHGAGDCDSAAAVSGSRRPVVVQKMADPWSAPQNLHLMRASFIGTDLRKLSLISRLPGDRKPPSRRQCHLFGPTPKMRSATSL